MSLRASRAPRRSWVSRPTIEKGDTLSKIAKQHFGNANAWKQIFEANRDTIDDPDRIFPGQVIKLPPKPADA